MTERNTVNSIHVKGVIEQKATFKMMSNPIHKKKRKMFMGYILILEVSSFFPLRYVIPATVLKVVFSLFPYCQRGYSFWLKI